MKRHIEVSDEDMKLVRKIIREVEWDDKRPTVNQLLAEAVHDGLIDLQNKAAEFLT